MKLPQDLESERLQERFTPERFTPERFTPERSAPERGFYWPMAGVALLLAVMLAGLSPLVRNAGGPFAGATPQYAPLHSATAQDTTDGAVKDAATKDVSAPGASVIAVAWQPSYEAARAAASAARKPLMVDFYADWCVWCKKMDSDTYTNRQVIEESHNFVNVKVNTDQRPDLARQYGVSGLPATVWMDNAGNIIESSSGYHPPAEFAQWMRAARSKFAPPG